MPSGPSKAMAAFFGGVNQQNIGGAIQAGARRGVDQGMDWEQELQGINTKRQYARTDADALRRQTLKDAAAERTRIGLENEQLAPDLALMFGEKEPDINALSPTARRNPKLPDWLERGAGFRTQRFVASEARRGRENDREKKYAPKLGGALPMKVTMDLDGNRVNMPDYERGRLRAKLPPSVTDAEVEALYGYPPGEERDNYRNSLLEEPTDVPPGGGAEPTVDEPTDGIDALMATWGDNDAQTVKDLLDSATDARLMHNYGVTKADALAAWQQKYGAAAEPEPVKVVGKTMPLADRGRARNPNQRIPALRAQLANLQAQLPTAVRKGAIKSKIADIERQLRDLGQ